MRILLALNGPTKRYLNGDLDWKSVLVSFEYKNQINFALQFKHLDFLLLDSGAFSAWSVGRNIDINEYSNWLNVVKNKVKHIKHFYCINLDVITNKNDNKEVLTTAYKESMKNLLYLQSKGHNPLPVFHQFEDFSILKEYASSFSYICISPNNRESNKSKQLWLDKVFGIIKSSVKTHGLAVTAEDLVMRYPWFSVDSSIDQVPYRYGGTGIRSKYLQPSDNKDATKNKFYTTQLSLLIRKHLRWIENSATNLWKQRGIIWTDL